MELPGDWLGFFDSDEARLVALAIVALTVAVVSLGRPIVRAWVEDRKDRRRAELEIMKAEHKLRLEMQRRNLPRKPSRD